MNSKNRRPNGLLDKLQDKDFRDAFVSSTVAARVAVRIFNLRKKMNWTQEKLAKEAGMKQARISVLEQADYENFSFNTLKRIAAAFDVAVMVDFVSFPDFLKWSDSLSAETVSPESFAGGPMVAHSEGQATLPRLGDIDANEDGIISGGLAASRQLGKSVQVPPKSRLGEAVSGAQANGESSQ